MNFAAKFAALKAKGMPERDAALLPPGAEARLATLASDIEAGRVQVPTTVEAAP